MVKQMFSVKEEVIVSFANHGPEDMYINICIKKKLGDVAVSTFLIRYSHGGLS